MRLDEVKVIAACGHHRLWLSGDACISETLFNAGRVFPTCKEDAEYIIRNEFTFAAMYYDDAEMVEALLAKHGKQGDYAVFRDHKVYLCNMEDVYQALIEEYAINLDEE